MDNKKARRKKKKKRNAVQTFESDASVANDKNKTNPSADKN